MYPDNDSEYYEEVIKSVEGESFTGEAGWSFWVGNKSQVQPKVGMTARIYGKGVGYSIRGLFLDGEKVFYRTVEEEKPYQLNQLYGKDAQEWVDRWDNGDSIWSIEMGGFGPGYEQAIQITVVETVRWLILRDYNKEEWSNPEVWKKDRDDIERVMSDNPIIVRLGLSGAQWGAALQLACKMYMLGPIAIMTDDKITNRKIQIRKNFPQG